MSVVRIGAGSRMSSAVIHDGKVYLRGIVAVKTAGKSVKEQTTDVLDQIDVILKEAGTDKTKVLRANYLADRY